MAAESPADDDLRTAYRQRSEQLYETRGALAEAVSALTIQLARLEDERGRLLADNEALRDEAHKLTDSLHAVHRQAEALDAELRAAQAKAAALANLRVVRWTVPLRQAIYRLRNPRG